MIIESFLHHTSKRRIRMVLRTTLIGGCLAIELFRCQTCLYFVLFWTDAVCDPLQDQRRARDAIKLTGPCPIPSDPDRDLNIAPSHNEAIFRV